MLGPCADRASKADIREIGGVRIAHGIVSDMSYKTPGRASPRERRCRLSAFLEGPNRPSRASAARTERCARLTARCTSTLTLPQAQGARIKPLTHKRRRRAQGRKAKLQEFKPNRQKCGAAKQTPPHSRERRGVDKTNRSTKQAPSAPPYRMQNILPHAVRPTAYGKRTALLNAEYPTASGELKRRVLPYPASATDPASRRSCERWC